MQNTYKYLQIDMYIYKSFIMHIHVLYILCLCHVYIIYNTWYILYMYIYFIYLSKLLCIYLSNQNMFFKGSRLGCFVPLCFIWNCSLSHVPFQTPLRNLPFFIKHFPISLPRKTCYLLYCWCPIVSFHNFISVSVSCKHAYLLYHLLLFFLIVSHLIEELYLIWFRSLEPGT